MAVGFYLLGALGITAGFLRYFTHRAFKANRTLRIGLAIAGSMAFQASIITWVADHCRHPAFADKSEASFDTLNAPQTKQRSARSKPERRLTINSSSPPHPEIQPASCRKSC